MKKLFLFLGVIISFNSFAQKNPEIYTLEYENKLKQEVIEQSGTGFAIPIDEIILIYSKSEDFEKVQIVKSFGNSTSFLVIPFLENCLLYEKSEEIKSQAANSLSNIKAVNSLPSLIKATNDKSLSVRLRVGLALAHLGEKQYSYKTLSKIWNKANWKEKLSCNLGFFEISNKKSINKLIIALNDENEYVAVSSAIYLAQLGYHSISFASLKKLSDNPNKSIRNAVIRGLAYIGNTESLELIKTFINDSNYQVRQRANNVLKEYGVKVDNVKSSYRNIRTTYDAQAAADYADLWWDGRNPAYYDYGTNDCSNFTSQCLIAGGLDFSDGTNGSGYGVDSWGAMYNVDHLDLNLLNYQSISWPS